MTNYKIVEHELRKYSFEFLKVSEEPLNMLKTLGENNSKMIESAKNLNLLAASIVYLYLKRNNLNGKGGITAKDVGQYFGVKASAISEKTFNVESALYGMKKNEAYEFIDRDRFEVGELYYNFLDSSEASDIKKSIKILKNFIKIDPDYFEPYLTLYEYYLIDKNYKKAIDIMEKGFERAINLIDNNGRFPDKLYWGFIENRHIIRMIFNFATFIWANEDKEIALNILMELLKSNHNDNIGARYSIVAILEGFESLEAYEEQFESKNQLGLEYKALEEWFYQSAEKHKDVIGWWLDLDEDF